MRRKKNHSIESLAASALMRRWWDMMKDVTLTGVDGVPIQFALDPVYVMKQAERAA